MSNNNDVDRKSVDSALRECVEYAPVRNLDRVIIIGLSGSGSKEMQSFLVQSDNVTLFELELCRAIISGKIHKLSGKSEPDAS